ARLRPPDDCAVARCNRPKSGLVSVDDRGDADVDRLRSENETGAAEAVNLEIEAAAAIRFPRVIDASRRRAGEIEVGPEQVEHFERHACDLGVDFGRGAASAGYGRGPAAEADARRGERPAVARAGQD